MADSSSQSPKQTSVGNHVGKCSEVTCQRPRATHYKLCSMHYWRQRHNRPMNVPKGGLVGELNGNYKHLRRIA